MTRLLASRIRNLSDGTKGGHAERRDCRSPTGPASARCRPDRRGRRSAAPPSRRFTFSPGDASICRELTSDGGCTSPTDPRPGSTGRPWWIAPADPAVLVVAFRLRWVRGIGHRMFRLESLLNTPLFVGFPGLVSKLWLAHDAAGVYRGVYQWDGAQSAGGLRPRLVARSGFGVRPGVDPLSRVCRAPTRRPLASARAGGPGERCGLVADDRHLDTEPLS